MSKKVEVTNVDQDFIDSHEGFTREQVFEYPTTPLLMKIYLEDKYMIFKNPDVNFDELKQKVKDITPFYLDKRQSDIASITKKEDIRNNRFLNHFENAIKYNRISFIDENRTDSKNNILTRLKHKLNSKIQLINDNTLSNKFSDLLQKEKNLLLLSLISTSNETTKKGDLFIEPLKQFTSCKIDIPLVIYLHSKYLQINSEHLTEYLNQKQCDLLNNFNLFEKIKHLRSMKTILRSKLHKLEHHLYLNKAKAINFRL